MTPRTFEVQMNERNQLITKILRQERPDQELNVFHVIMTLIMLYLTVLLVSCFTIETLDHWFHDLLR